MRHITMPALVLSLAATFADATETAVSPAPPPPRANPQAQAQMQALIDRTPKAAGAFRADAFGNVVHIQSGMKCATVIGEPRPLSGLYVGPVVRVGDDVGCDWHGGEVKISVFVTKLDGTPIAQYAQEAVAAIRQIHPDAGTEVPIRTVGNPALARPFAGGFPITVNGRAFVTSICVGEEHGWAVKVRATYPKGTAEAETAAALRCSQARQDVHDFTPANGR